MNLAELPEGSSVVIDANILIFRKLSAQCGEFLARCGKGEFRAAIPPDIYNPTDV